MKESPYGLHRVVSPRGAFPQAADRLDTSLPIRDSEILIEVDRLNVDSASFYQMLGACGNLKRLKAHVLKLVRARGKLHNPVTNSGGMLLGTVCQVGKGVRGRGFRVGDRVATLVSLTLTPLHLEKILRVDVRREQLLVQGHAILFASNLAEKMPSDLPEEIALAVLDVCGAPALVSHLARSGQTVVILGAGKAGVLSAAAVRRKMGRRGKVLMLEKDPRAVRAAQRFSFVDRAAVMDLKDPIKTLETVSRLTQGCMADLVVNCVNVPRTEVASIMAAKRGGTVLYFNMATNFQAAVLGAEGIGHETRLIMGNGYSPGHADLALNLVRQDPSLRRWFER